MNDAVIFTIVFMKYSKMYGIETKNAECKYMEKAYIPSEMLADCMTVIAEQVNNVHKKACLFEMD